MTMQVDIHKIPEFCFYRKRLEDEKAIALPAPDYDVSYISEQRLENDRVTKLFRALGASPTVSRLELWDVILSQEAIVSLGRCLTSTRTIHEVVLSGNELRDEGVSAISEGFKRNLYTARLSIWHNQVGDAGSEALASALQSGGLVELNLIGNEIGDKGAVSFSKLLGRNHGSLARLNLGSNRISDVGAAAIGKRLSKDHRIVEIGLQDNKIGIVGVQGLEAGLRSNEGLLDLHLWGNRVSRQDLCAIEKHLHTSRMFRNRAFSALEADDCGRLDYWFFSAGVSRFAYNDQRESLLACAAKKGSLPLVKEIAKGIFPWCRDTVFRKPLEIARGGGHQVVSAFLFQEMMLPQKLNSLYPLTVWVTEANPLEEFCCKMPLIQARLGYTFSNQDLLLQAFTHSSFKKEYPDLVASDNERLEWWGDSVLGHVISERLYATYPQLQQGGLTVMRSNAVSNEACASYITQLEVGEFLLLGSQERVRTKHLADLFEAITGAIEKDGGQGPVRRLVFDRLTISFSNAQIKGEGGVKMLLQKACPYVYGALLIYEVQAESSPDFGEYFTARILANEVLLGEGKGRLKREAEEKAATKAIEALKGELQLDPIAFHVS